MCIDYMQFWFCEWMIKEKNIDVIRFSYFNDETKEDLLKEFCLYYQSIK